MYRTTVEHLIRPLGTFPSKGKVWVRPSGVSFQAIFG